MTNFTKKTFSVGASGTDAYRENWERTFRARCGARQHPGGKTGPTCTLELRHAGSHYAELGPGATVSWEPAE